MKNWWTYLSRGRGWIIADERDGHLVASEILDARDARLIAAAPDLLEACRALLAWKKQDPSATVVWMTLSEDVVPLVLAATRKAVGEDRP